MEGKIALVIFPQDVFQKRRPALVLREFPKYGDLLLCGITSQIHQHIPGFDLLLNDDTPYFKITGLKKPSVCRLNTLMMVPETDVVSTIGQISKEAHYKLLKNLADYLTNSNQ